MNKSNFIYRQRQKLKYHFSRSFIDKQIAEINKNQKQVIKRGKGFYIEAIDLTLPSKHFERIITRFDLFISNAKDLNGKYYFNDNYLYFEWNIFKVIIDSVSDLFIINEIFIQLCYQFILPNNKPINIIDVGMNVGFASLFFSNFHK